MHHNGPTTQRELADALKVTPRNVTGLVAGGFVTRERHPTDALGHVASRLREGLRAAGERGR